jgi:lysophospholipase L1-like esterase
MTLIFKPEETITFIGDSITDCERRTPAFEPLGCGYVYHIHCLLRSVYPDLDLAIINKGISGDRVTDLRNRWQSDVLDINPAWLFIYIGINDVWRFFEGDQNEGVSLGNFSDTYRQLISAVQTKTKAQIQLIAPFLAESDPTDPFRRRLAQYQTAIDELGVHFNLPVICLQPAFDRAMHKQPSTYWTSDRVHPTDEGHMLIALTILRVCKFELPIH